MFEHPGITSSKSLGTEASAYSSPAFNDAVNAARFVKGFGIAALVYTLFVLIFGILLGGGLGLGIGLFILRYDATRYYRILGIIVMLFAIVGAFIPYLGPAVLSGAIMWKGIQVLGILAREGRNDEAWVPSRKRVLTGTVTSGLGLLISIILMFLFTLSVIVSWLAN
jgi:hypothetical protein